VSGSFNEESDMNIGAEDLMVPCSYARIVARELGLQERALAQLLRGTGLGVSILLGPADTHISAAQQMRVLENAQQIGGRSEFGLQLGRRLHPSSHGPMGYLVLSSPDVITALQSFADFLPVRLPFASVQITLDDRWLSCTLALKIDVQPTIQRVLKECFALMIQSVVESVMGYELHDAKIELAYPKPRYHPIYSDYLHSPVCFSRQSSVFRIPAEVARFPNVSGNSEAYRLTQDLCRRLLENMPATDISTADRVKRLLLAAPIGSLTATDIAGALFVTKRTLQRRLEQEGTSYRDITEKLHSELASQHLREPGQTVESISALLGYCDTAAFRKAFRRWYGQSPGEYRRNV
jgi:AraC-like DNA-binding protein